MFHVEQSAETLYSQGFQRIFIDLDKTKDKNPLCFSSRFFDPSFYPYTLKGVTNHEPLHDQAQH